MPSSRNAEPRRPANVPARGAPAARSFEESALRHEELARVQDRTVEQGVSEVALHRESAAKHREAAVDDRKLAELKRKESEADLSLAADN